MWESTPSTEQKPLIEAFELLHVSNLKELSAAYTDEDQRLMKEGLWDYENQDLLTNKVKDLLEATDTTQLTDEEKEFREEILWFWYHHAISCAAARYKDKEAAQQFAIKALKHQSEDHPNQITKILKYLVFDELESAEELAEKIEIDYEKETAEELISIYKEGKFFSGEKL